MNFCRNCGKPIDDDKGLCPDCEGEDMDDFATMIINSPFNPMEEEGC